MIRIGAGTGFYGDSPRGAIDVARLGRVGYICFDHLAELTLAILQKDRQRDPNLGYAQDISAYLTGLLPICRQNNIRLISNAGGLNPAGAAEQALKIAAKLGLPDLKVAVVTGDDILGRLDDLPLRELTAFPGATGPGLAEIKDRLVFANAYLGGQPILQALDQGAELVITGRVADASLFAAPAGFELGWDWTDWDRLAAGVVAGHLLECSGQSTGGNFSGRWWEVPDMDRLGYPVAEIEADGGLVITKPDGTGGLVSPDTVKEQLYYEVHDPAAYLNPDVSVDISRVGLEQIGPDRVRVEGVTGAPRPDQLKVVMGYHDGFMGWCLMGYSWPDALDKARKAEEIVRNHLEKSGIKAQEVVAEYWGANALHGPTAPLPEEPNEIFLRMAIKTDSRREAAAFPRLFPSALGLNGPPFIGGFLPGLPKPVPLLGQYACLVDREAVETGVKVELIG